tara:strand:+ start:1115 stop:1921 length:807 start_codon:yes stop_codon:yes gene_type:complete
MNILIIGGNRFVGKLIAKKLIPTHNITIINRKGTGPEGCTILKGDRNNTLEFINKLSNFKFDIVIDMCLYNPEQCLIIDKLFLGKISKYIFMSSIASKMDGFGEYGVNKKKCEEFLKSSSIPYIILQPTYIIGKGDHSDRIKYYVDRILDGGKISIDGKGDGLINFIDSEDVCDVVCTLVSSSHHHKTKNITYELSCDNNSSLNDLVWNLSQFSHKNILPKTEHNSPKDSPYTNKKCFANNSKVKEHLDFQFINFQDTLKKVFYEYKS